MGWGGVEQSEGLGWGEVERSEGLAWGEVRQSLLVSFVITSVRYSFGYLKNDLRSFPGRILVGNNCPIVRKLRQETIFRTAATNMVSERHLDVKSVKNIKLN